jgi:hypothetical protein
VSRVSTATCITRGNPPFFFINMVEFLVSFFYFHINFIKIFKELYVQAAQIKPVFELKINALARKVLKTSKVDVDTILQTYASVAERAWLLPLSRSGVI